MNFKKLTGKVITKDDFEYEESRQAWNRAIQKYPQAIVYCQNEEDVMNALKFSKENKIPFRIRSGSHHYEGYSTGNDLLVIDVSHLNKIKLDEVNQIVTVEGGVRNRELYEAVCGAGYPFPGGGCPTVGVAGFTLGGGWGYSSRLYGLGCDSLIEAEVIDYKGDKLVANHQMNPDLYWALKGGGSGSFGVVTKLTYKLPEKMAMCTLVNIDYQRVSVEKVIEVASRYQQFFKDLDRRLNLKMAMYNSETKGQGVRLTGIFYGTKEEADALLNQFNDGKDYDLDYMSVLEANRAVQDSHPDFEKYRSGGRFIYRHYTEVELKEMLHLIEVRAEGSLYTAITFYGVGGAVSDVSPQESAYYYRDAIFILGFQSVWEESKYAPTNRQWVEERFKILSTYTEGSFINFPIAQQNYEKQYYGENLPRLKLVKAKYDPDNFFNFEQGIKW